MSLLKKRLSEEIKQFLKSQEKQTLGFARTLHAAIRKKEIDERIELDDPAILKIVTTQLKQREEALVHFEKANREDLVAKERLEIAYLSSFLPEPFSEEELMQKIDAAIVEAKAVTSQDLGKVLKIILPQVASKADSKHVVALVSHKLSQGV